MMSMSFNTPKLCCAEHKPESMNTSWATLPEINVCAENIDRSSPSHAANSTGLQEESRSTVMYFHSTP